MAKEEERKTRPNIEFDLDDLLAVALCSIHHDDYTTGFAIQKAVRSIQEKLNHWENDK